MKIEIIRFQSYFLSSVTTRGYDWNFLKVARELFTSYVYNSELSVGELCIRDVSDANVECSELYCQMLMIVRLKGEGGLSLLPPIINTI